MNDPLAQYRRATATRATTTAEPQQTDSKRPYEAYDKQGKPSPFTEIRSLAQPSQAPQSRFLLSVIFSADAEEAFTLIYSFQAVEIKGRNLQEVRQAMQHGRCSFLQEYDERRYHTQGQGEPVITSIRFITSDKLDDLLASFKAL